MSLSPKIAAIVSTLLVVMMVLIQTAMPLSIKMVNKNAPQKRGDDDWLPGYNYMLSGFDVRSMQSSSNSMDPSKNVVNLIFKPTSDFGTKYRMPTTKENFKVPDAIEVYDYVTTNVTKTSDTMETMSESLKYEASSYSFQFSVSVGVVGVTAGLNTSFGHIHQTFKNNNLFMATGSIRGTLYQAVLEPPTFLEQNPYFKRAMDAIPSSPTSADLDKIQTLIKYFGVSYVSKGIFGGKFDLITKVSDEILKSYDKSWCITQLSLTFSYGAYSFGMSGFNNKTDIHIDNDFANKAKSDMFFVGGDFSLQSNETLKEWYQTIPSQPALIGGQFSLISDLIDNNAVKKKNLEAILKNYISTGVVEIPSSLKRISVPHPVKRNALLELSRIPGSNLIGSGFDTFTLTPRLSLFKQASDSTATTWTNPIYNNIQFAVPGNVLVRNNAESYYANSTFVALTKQEYEYEYRKHSSHSGMFGLSHHSKDVFIYNYRYEFEDQYQLNTFRRISWYDLSLDPICLFDLNNRLDPFAKRMIDSLPATGGNTADVREKYKKFIDYYGTAVVTKTTMGGGIFFKINFKKDLTNTLSINEIHEQSGWSFFHIFGQKSTRDFYLKKLSQQFIQHSSVEFNTQGGAWTPEINGVRPTGPNALNIIDSPEGYMSWEDYADTIKYDPYPVNYELQPIHTIFADKAKQSIMQSVLDEYLQEKYNQKPASFSRAGKEY